MKRKALALLLALTLCMGLSIPALAASSKQIGSIEVSNVVSEDIFETDDQEECPLWTVNSPCTITLTANVYPGELGCYVQKGTFDEDEKAYFSGSEDDLLIPKEDDLELDAQGNVYLKKGAKYVLTEAGPYWVVTEDFTKSLVIYVTNSEAPATEVPAPEAPAPDVPSSWAAESVNAAIAKKLVPDTLQSKYTQATTRAEFCALAVALYETATGSEITERAEFTDTDDINVQKMAGLGVVNGIGDGTFAPNQQLTREQAATMLSRLADAMGKPLTAATTTFSDSADISSWAVDAVGQMQATSIMTGVGDNAFSPKTDYTREQSIVTMLRMLEAVK